MNTPGAAFHRRHPCLQPPVWVTGPGHRKQWCKGPMRWVVCDISRSPWASAWAVPPEDSARKDRRSARAALLADTGPVQARSMRRAVGRAPRDMRALLAPPVPRRWSVPRVGTACREWASAVCVQLVCMDPVQARPMRRAVGRVPRDMRALLAPPVPRRSSVPRVGTACRKWASAWAVPPEDSARMDRRSARAALLADTGPVQAWPMPFVAGRAPRGTPVLRDLQMPRHCCVLLVGTARRARASAHCAQRVSTARAPVWRPAPVAHVRLAGRAQWVRLWPQVLRVRMEQAVLAVARSAHK